MKNEYEIYNQERELNVKYQLGMDNLDFYSYSYDINGNYYIGVMLIIKNGK